MGITDLGNVVVAIKADIDDYQKAAASVSDLTAAMGSSLQSFGTTVRRTGTILTAMGGVAALALGGIVQSTRSLNDSMREVSTLMDINQNAADTFGASVANLSREFANQGGVADALQVTYEALSAGFTDTNDALQVTSTVLELARVGFVDTNQAAIAVTRSINAFGLSADDAQHVADVLFSTVQFGSIRFDELERSMIPIMGTMDAVGATIEQTAASMALLTKEGLPARRAAFELRSAATKLLKPSQDLKTALVSIAMDGLVPLSDNVQNAIDNFKEQQTKLKDVKADFRAQQQEVESATQAYNDLGDELSGLQDHFDELSNSMRDNRIKIMEIRYAAEKQGRELTDKEKKRIKELEVANDGLRIQQLKQEKQMDAVRKKREDAQKTMDQEKSKLQDLKKQYEDQQGVVSDARDNIGKYAGSISQSLVQQEGFGGALQMIRDRLDKLNIPLQDAFNNVRAYDAVLKITGKNHQEYEKILNGVINNQGVVDEQWQRLADTAGSNLNRAIQNLRAAWRAFGQDLIKALIPVLHDLNGFLTNIRKSFENMDPALRQNIARFAILATAIALTVGPLLMLIGQIMIGIGALAAGGVGSGFIATLGAAAIAVGGFGLALKEITGNMESGKQGMEEFTAALANLKDIATGIADVFSNDIAPVMANFIDGVIKLGRQVADKVGPGFRKFASSLSDVGNEVVRIFKELTSNQNVNQIFANLRDTILQVADVIGPLIGDIGDWISANDKLIAKIVTLEPIVKGLASVLVDLSGYVLAAVRAFAQWSRSQQGRKVIAALAAAVTGLVIVLGKAITWVGNFIQEHHKLVSQIAIAVGAFLAAVAVINTFAAVIGTAIAVVSGIVGAAGAMIDAFGIVGAIVYVVLDAIITLIDWIAGAVGGFEAIVAAASTVWTVLEVVAGVIITVVSAIGALGVAILGIIAFIVLWQTNLFNFRDTVNTVIDKILEFADEAVTAFKGFIADVVNYFQSGQAGTDLANAFTAALDSVQTVVQSFFEVGGKIWNEIATFATNFKEYFTSGQAENDMRAGFEATGEALRNATDDFINNIWTAIEGFVSDFKQYFSSGKAQTDMVAATHTVGKAIHDAWVNTITNILQSIADFGVKFYNYWTSGKGFTDSGKAIRTALNQMFTLVQDFWSFRGMIWNVISDFIDYLVIYFTGGQFSKDVVSSMSFMLGAILDTWKLTWDMNGYVWKVISGFVSDLVQYIGSGQALKDIVKANQDLLHAITNAWIAFFKGLFYGSIIKDFFADLGKYIRSGAGFDLIKGAFDALIGAVGDIWSGFKNWLVGPNGNSGFIGNMVGGITNILNGFSTSGITSKLQGVIDKANNAISKVAEALKQQLHLGSGGGGGGGNNSAYRNNAGATQTHSTSSYNNAYRNTGGATATHTSAPTASGQEQRNKIVSGGTMIGLASGGFIKAKELPAMLHGPEWVLNPSQMSSLISNSAILGARIRATGGGGQAPNITVLIESGAFKGVSDEELPKKVGDEVDSKLQRLVADLQGKGY